MVVPGAPIVSCLKAFFGPDAQVPVGQIYRTHTLARQRVGLDDSLGRRPDPVTGERRLIDGEETFIDGSFAAVKKGGPAVGKTKGSRGIPLGGYLFSALAVEVTLVETTLA